MMIYRKFFFSFLISFLSCALFAQGDLCSSAENGANGGFAWLDPAIPDVTDSVYIYINVAADPNCATLTGSAGPLYVWTWSPAAVDNQLGSWDNSDEGMIMQHVSDDVWRFGLIPTEFYGVEAADVYDLGLCFLAKEKNGGSGGDCGAGGGEFKTTDIWLEVPAAFVPERKVRSFPDVVEGDTLYSRRDDVFTLSYNQNLEENEGLVGESEFYVFPRAIGDNGSLYSVVSPFNANTICFNDDNANLLRMATEGDSRHQFSIIPEEFFADALPDGVNLAGMQFQIVKCPFANTNDVVDGDDNQGKVTFRFKCD